MISLILLLNEKKTEYSMRVFAGVLTGMMAEMTVFLRRNLLIIATTSAGSSSLGVTRIGAG